MVHCFVEESVINRLGLRTSRNVVTLRLAYLAVSASNYNLSVSSVKSREKIIMKVNCQSHYFQFKLCLFFYEKWHYAKVTVLGAVSRKPRKLFGPLKPLQNLEPCEYRAVLFTYSKDEGRFPSYKKFRAYTLHRF